MMFIMSLPFGSPRANITIKNSVFQTAVLQFIFLISINCSFASQYFLNSISSSLLIVQQAKFAGRPVTVTHFAG